jgi:flavin reductase (DIM6/NTAB) family NADH-FMN oxidoreductase RutF
MDKKALFSIVYGLYVATAGDGGKDNGCITNTPIQVTSTPERIALTLNKANHTTGLIEKTGSFNLSCLTENTPFEVFQRFGFQSGRDVEKFTGFPHLERSANGLYYLTEYSNAFLSGKVVNTVDLGTHLMFVADLEDAGVLRDAKTVTYSYYQANIKPNAKPAVEHGWKCNICGYIHESEDLPADFICPICKHGASDFTKF